MSKNDWNSTEIDVAVVAYFELLDRTSAGEQIVKAAFYREVSELLGGVRSVKSIERKFQNIAFVLETMNEPRVQGLPPLRNTQAALHKRVNIAVQGRRDSVIVADTTHLRLVA